MIAGTSNGERGGLGSLCPRLTSSLDSSGALDGTSLCSEKGM